MDDSRIIELFYERSEQAITELSNKYGKIFARVAANILNNRQDAEECVNDAYLGAWNTIPPQNPNPLLSYVCRIVRNLAVKRYHSNSAVKRNSIYDVALDELEGCIPASSSAEVENEFDAKETAHIIDDFLETLDMENRIMFIRRYWYSDSIPEIAESLNTSSHNVSVRLFRTREKLKKYLIKKGVSL